MKMVITESQYKRLINESGIRNINELAKPYKKAKIYFHQDLDGVTTAIGMKSYLENYGIKVVDAEVIQYGDKEFSVKKPDASGDVMPVLVDFADLLMKNKSIHTVRGEGWSNVARAVSLLGSGKITLKPYVTHTFPLDEITTAFETFVKRIEGAVKVVVKSSE